MSNRSSETTAKVRCVGRCVAVGSPNEEMRGHGHGERRTGKKTVENEEEVCG